MKFGELERSVFNRDWLRNFEVQIWSRSDRNQDIVVANNVPFRLDRKRKWQTRLSIFTKLKLQKRRSKAQNNYQA